MRPTPISREIIDRAIDEYGIIDYANATIREVKAIAERAERESGQEFIKMEMGIPGLPAAKIGVEAQIKALQNGCARLYPALPGEPTVGMQHSAGMSMSIKALMKREVASLIMGSPGKAG